MHLARIRIGEILGSGGRSCIAQRPVITFPLFVAFFRAKRRFLSLAWPAALSTAGPFSLRLLQFFVRLLLQFALGLFQPLQSALGQGQLSPQSCGASLFSPASTGLR